MDQATFQRAKLFAFRDIQRELSLARASETEEGRGVLSQLGIEPGGGNFLAALGLLCYTEFGGKLKYDCRHPNGREHASENFNRFFDELGTGYQALRAAGHNIYDIFRCGLAHEYWVKRACTIAMLEGGHQAAIYVQPDGRYMFAVEQYYRDLAAAFDSLEAYLVGPGLSPAP
jgi:hypothetical protein